MRFRWKFRDSLSNHRGPPKKKERYNPGEFFDLYPISHLFSGMGRELLTRGTLAGTLYLFLSYLKRIQPELCKAKFQQDMTTYSGNFPFSSLPSIELKTFVDPKSFGDSLIFYINYQQKSISK